MSARAGDCPHCGAPAPIIGEIEHSRFCDRPPFGRFLFDPPNGWIDDGMSADESRAALIALARRVENAWAERAGRRETVRESEITLPRARESVLSSYA